MKYSTPLSHLLSLSPTSTPRFPGRGPTLPGSASFSDQWHSSSAQMPFAAWRARLAGPSCLSARRRPHLALSSGHFVSLPPPHLRSPPLRTLAFAAFASSRPFHTSAPSCLTCVAIVCASGRFLRPLLRCESKCVLAGRAPFDRVFRPHSVSTGCLPLPDKIGKPGLRPPDCRDSVLAQGNKLKVRAHIIMSS